MAICPNCGMENPGGDFCAGCGASLNTAAPKSRLRGNLNRSAAGTVPADHIPAYTPAVEVPAPAPVREAKFCMFCGAAMDAEERFCSACGGDSEASSYPAAAPAAPVREPVAPPPVRKTAPPKNEKRISIFRELLLLLEEGTAILLGETRNLIISLLFPLGAAAITVWIAGENMYENFESTKSACFILVCAAIWGGLFNSIQVIVKERDNVKRDYVSGALRIECFVASRAIIQMVLCAIQAAVLCLSFFGVDLVYGNQMPNSGLIFGGPFIEYYITVFLVMFAADTMGLMISCIVKSEQLASQLSPYILIVQLLFSGVLFAMEGAAESVSALMLSRWGMEGLGSISELNDLPLRIISESDEPEMLEQLIDRSTDSAFLSTSDHLWEVWLILLLFVLVPLIIGDVLLYRVKKDTR